MLSDLKESLRNQYQNIKTWKITQMKRHQEWDEKRLRVYKRVPAEANREHGRGTVAEGMVAEKTAEPTNHMNPQIQEPHLEWDK